VRSIACLFALLSFLGHPAGGTPTIYYAVILKPVAGRELSLPIVEKHARHLAELDAQGKLVMAGPFVDNPLGLLIMKGSSKAEITHILNDDPMITSGAKTFEVATWVLANRGNKFMPPIPPPQNTQRGPQ
jgi:uncharacterized protein YciI